MEPADAVRQLEYVVAPKLGDDAFGHWERAVYGDVFATVADRGTRGDVSALVGLLGDDIEDGVRPSPDRARAHAEDLLSAGTAAD